MGQPNQSSNPNPPPKSKLSHLTALFPKHPDGKPKFITEPSEFNDTMERLATSGLCNLLCSIQYVDYIPPVQAVSLRVIVAREDMYYTPKNWGDGFALKGTALAALFREAGGQYRRSERMDDRSDPLVCHMSATVVMRAMNGLDAPFTKDREIDLRPGSPEDKAMATEKQRSQAQQTIMRVCETKAQLRAMREAIGAKQSYTGADAALPYVIPVLVPNPDMNNPVHANFMLAHSMGQVDTLYGKKALPPASVTTEHGTVDAHTGEIIDAETVDDIPQAEPEVARCGCPCNCTAEVPEATAKFTLEKRKGVRCTACWPGSQFDHGRHKNLGSLGLDPDVAPRDVKRSGGGR